MFGITPFSGAPFSAIGEVVPDTIIALTSATASGLVSTLNSDLTIVADGVFVAVEAGVVSDKGIGSDITGVGAAVDVGTVALSAQISLSGDVATESVGSLGSSRIVSVSGVSAAGAVGTLTGSRTVALTSATASGLLGAFALSHTNSVTGVSAEGTAGTVSDKGIGTDITGDAAAGSVGTVTQSVQVALSGVEAAGQAGYLIVPLSSLTADGSVGSVQFEFSFGLTSAAIESSVGSLGLADRTLTLTGVSVTGFVNTVDGYLIVPLSSVSATGSVGSVQFGFDFGLTGAAIAASVGSLGLAGRTLALTGVSAAGSVGTLISAYWKLIDDSENANWIAINSTQTPGWSTIQDTQTANWVLVDNVM